MNNICHCEEISEDRKATAPYNFVPLPEKYFSWSDINGTCLKPWENNDKYCENTYSGCISFSVDLKTPLYIRGQKKKLNNQWDNRASNEIIEPYTDSDGKPCIPSSSFRGMIRNIVEIMSFSNISQVSNKKLFYRNFSPGNVSAFYRRKFSYSNINAGYFHWNEDGSGYIQTCYCSKYEEGESLDNYIKITIGKDDLIKNYIFEKEELIDTKSKPKKNVRKDIIDLFESEDQITAYQRDKFPQGENGRYKAGALKEGEPVFYIEDKNNEVCFIGRARYFRVPFDYCATDLVGNVDFDYLSFSDGLFGKIDKNDKNKTIKSRVYFSDLHCKKGTEVSTEGITPKILASPNSKCYQLYLVQESDENKNLISYFNDSDKNKLIRGHKLYWNRWNDTNHSSNNDVIIDEQVKFRQTDDVEQNENMTTSIKLVLSGGFEGNIRFSNITEFELGGLLTSLELPDYCCHKIGMGKPLGLGSIKIYDIKLQLIDFNSRYKNWQNNGLVEKSDKEKYKTVFMNKIVELASKNKERFVEVDNYESNNDFNKIYRINSLFKILNWDNKPKVTDTDYMPADSNDSSDFSAQKVLPTPYVVMNNTEPKFVELKIDNNKDLKTLIKELLRLNKKEKKERNLDSLCQNGQTREGVFVYIDDNWKAYFEGDIRIIGDIAPKSIPENIKDGEKASFLIKVADKNGLKVEFKK